MCQIKGVVRKRTISCLCHYYYFVFFCCLLLFRSASSQSENSLFNCVHFNSENGSSSFSQKLSGYGNSRQMFLRHPYIRFDHVTGLSLNSHAPPHLPIHSDSTSPLESEEYDYDYDNEVHPLTTPSLPFHTQLGATRIQIPPLRHLAQCEDFPGKISYYDAHRDPVLPNSHARSFLQLKMLEMFYGDTAQDSINVQIPDISQVAEMCPSNAFFFSMNRRHMRAVEMVKDMFMEEPGATEVYLMANALRWSTDLHPTVWYEGLMKAMHERRDMDGMVMPGPMDAIPDSFVPSESFYGGLGRNGRHGRPGRHNDLSDVRQECARIDGSVGRDNGVENRLWYWREDVLLNSHHWYWHLAHPLNSTLHPDRRGELFYYFHHGVIARHNIERMTNGLDRVEPLPTFPGSLLNPPYFAHLDDTNSGMRRTDRPPNTPLSDIDHSSNTDLHIALTVEQWNEYGRRIGSSITNGFIVSRQGSDVVPDTFQGIDIVGNTVEATDISFNPDYYSQIGYHNYGHVFIALAVDPDYQFQLPPGVMGDTATAMRDPIFYHWHTNIDNSFDDYKRTLPPYQPIGGDFPLLWNGVQISNVQVLGFESEPNELRTFWNERNFELGVGLAFDRNASNGAEQTERLNVCLRHLDHEEFVYQMEIDRSSCSESTSEAATIRIFLAPRFDEHGFRFSFAEQRRLFVPLDLFSINLSVGKNIVTRRSMDSSLTIPWQKSLQQLQAEFGTNPEPLCGCGWPHHLLLPKGTGNGWVFDLFVMVTNGDEDIVTESSVAPELCRSAPMYCGIRNRRYPDARPMGYPLDRLPYRIPIGGAESGNLEYTDITSLEEYASGISNMRVTQIKISHVDDDG